jgi:hypothetical protein
LTGPSTTPSGSVTIPAGSDTGSYNTPSTVYYFATGTHTIGSGEYNQIIPGNNDTYEGAPGAILSGQQKNDYAFTGSATGVTVEYLTITDFGVYTSDTSDSQAGVVNHDTATGWTIEHNTITQNGGAGAMIGDNGVAEYNCFSENGQYGFQTYQPLPGTTNVTIDYNEFYNNDEGGYDLHTGCGCAAASGKFWTTAGATFANNYVHTDSETDATFTGDPCVWADTGNSGLSITGNYLSGCNAEGIDVEASYFNTVAYNTIINSGGGYVANSNIAGFPSAAVYVSESGYDTRAPAETGGAATITGNVFTNDAGGVILWENSNRFCGDGFDGICTSVDSAATMSTCPTSSTKASSETLYYDCRWRTQNVQVTNNVESLTVASVPNCNQSTNDCGFNGVFSEYASYTPYLTAASPNTCDNQGTISACKVAVPNSPWAIPQLITADQGNVFSNNTYCGPWEFMGGDQGNAITFANWQKGSTDTSDGSGLIVPAQDAGSTSATSCSGGGTTTTTTQPTTTTTTQPTTTTTQPTNYTGPVVDLVENGVGSSSVTLGSFTTAGPNELLTVAVSGRGQTGQAFAVADASGLTFTEIKGSQNGNEYAQVFEAEATQQLVSDTVTCAASRSNSDLRCQLTIVKQ